MGKKLVFVPECHSTNTLATELSQKEDLPEGAVVITNHQTKGRGQQGNAWISERGKNLTLSAILKPSFMAIKDQFLLNMVASLSIKDFIQDKLEDTVSVKWPNDVLVNDLKLCGILIENQIQGESFTNSVIGIGLNVNQKGFYSKNATSLAIITGREFQLQEVMEQVLTILEKWYLVLKQNDHAKIKRAYLTSLYGVNQTKNFKTKSDVFEGIIRGVDDVGRLMIETQVGTRYFNTKEVQFDFEPFK